MIVIVLFMLLLLAGVLTASLRLGLSSRQTTADQAATLRAQYDAESGLALARSRLQDVQAMLSFNSPRVVGGAGLKLAPNVKISAVQDWVSRLCGIATWQEMYEGREANARGFLDRTPDPNDAAEEKFYPSAQKCTPAGLTSSSQFALFANIVTPEAYQVLPADEAPAANTEARQAFWQNLLTQTGNSTAGRTTLTTKVGIDRVLRLTSNHSRVYLAVKELNAAATEGTAGRIRRTVTASGTQPGLWWFDIVQPSLLDATIQTDYQTSAAGGVVFFTNTTNFQGPLKTNDVFAFLNASGNNSPSFTGKLTSAGCTSRIDTATETSCIRQPGVRVGSGGNPTPNRNFTGTDSAKSTAIQSYIAKNSVKINYNGITPNFAGQYQPFPTNSGNQANAANGLDESGLPLLNERGLVLDGTQVSVQLYVGDSDGNPATVYNTNQRVWNEPNPAYQYIRPATGVNCTKPLAFDVNGCTYTYSAISYRVDANKNIQQKTGTAAWVPIPGKFNGVIYKDGDATILGPGRGTSSSSDTVTQARPALASFSGITLAATGDVTVRSDLAMSQTPCRNDEYSTLQVDPPCANRQNVLGLFSSAGSVIVGRQAPNNVVLQTAMMSSNKEFTVDGYDTGSSRGNIKFTGSLVEKYYGPNGTTGGTGYGRDYSYDRRFLDGLTPPSYPVSPKWDFYDASSRGGDFSDLIWKQGTTP